MGLLLLPAAPAYAQTTPATPTNLVATAVAYSQINLSWSDIATNEDSFKIERSADGTNFTQISQVLSNTVSYRNTGLWLGTTYYYRVRAYSSASDSSFSSVSSVSTPVLCAVAVVGWGDNSYGQITPPAGATGTVAVAAGSGHSLALRSDGTVVGWGDNSDGQATPPVGLSNAVAIAAGGLLVGGNHSLALKSDSTIVGWGDNYFGQGASPAGLTGVVAIAAGGEFSLVLKSNGTIVAWGNNNYGQATPPTNMTGVVAIAGGFFHGLALKSDGTVVGWGYNGYGQTVPPTNLTGVVTIAAGSQHSLALKSDGTVVGWGRNDSGEATPPSGLSDVVAISAGFSRSLALKSDGTVIAWGSSSGWIPPLGLTGVVTIAAGSYHGLALTCMIGTPSSLSATVVSSNQITVSWTDASGNEDGFEIERAPDNGGAPGAWAQIAIVGANFNSYTDTGLVLGATYWYRVRAYNANDHSGYSNQAGTTIPFLPGTPSSLSAATISTHVVSLSWTDSYGDENGFRVERALDSGGSPSSWIQIAVVGTNVTTHADTGLSPNTTYWYRVRAYNVSGNSDPSNLAAATTGPLGPLSLLAVTAFTNQINLSWVDNDGTESGFKIDRALDGGGSPTGWTQTAIVGANVTNYNDVGLSLDKTYWYRVRAYSAGGNSDYSNLTNATTPPLRPSSLTAVAVSTNQINLGWANNASHVSGFRIERATDAGGSPGSWVQIASVSSNATNYSDTNSFTVGLVYWYRVRAYNTGGDSDYSTLANAMVPFPPSAPSGLTASPGKQINLTWQDNSSNEDGFKIDRAPDSGGNPGTWAQVGSVSANITNYNDTGLLPNATYWYHVRAYNAGGDSDYSNQASATTPNLAAPSVLTAVAVSTNQINSSWTDNSTNEDGFAVERAPDAGGSPDTWSQIATMGANVTNYNDTAVLPGTNYWYRVRAYRATEGSDYSNQATAATPAMCPRLVVGWGNNSRGQATPPTGLEWVVAIAAGYEHSLALKSNGTVVAWGNNSSGQTNVPAGLSSVVAIDAGDYHSLALKSNGLVVGWGSGSPATPPAGLSNVVAIAAGRYQSLALKSDGRVVSWGSGTPPAGLSNVTAIAAGSYFSMALKSDGKVVVWDGGPTPPTGLSNVVAIAAGEFHALALKSDGTVVGWGSSYVPPAGLSNVVAIAAGNSHDLALQSDGMLVAWGYNYSGQTNIPSGLNRVTAVAGGGGHSLALTLPCSLSAPSALTATAVSYRQINLSWLDNSGDETSFKVERSIDGANFTQIAQKSRNTTSHLDANLMPGKTYYYRVRASNTADDSEHSNVLVAGTPAMCAASVVRWSSSLSTPPAGWTGIVAIAVGYNQTLGLRIDGTVVNWYGYAPPAGLTGVVSMASGGQHNLALKGDGTVVGWGSNTYGQTNPPAGLSGVVAITAGYYHSLALKHDGTVISWGRNNFGQTNTPAGLTGVVAITAGYYQSLALKSDGTVIGWGGNLYGEASPPSGLLATAISAGSYHSLALKKDGTVVGWGDNSWGKATPPANLTGVVAIAAGNYHSLTLKNDGTVIGWGNSSYGNSPAGLTGVVAIAACNYENMAMSCAPSPPCCLSATGVGASQIDLNWTDNSSNEERFGIERAGTSTGPWTEIGSVDSNVTTYSDAGVSCSQTYYYRVRAYNAEAGSPYTSPVSANTSNADADSDGIRDCWTLHYFGHPTGQESDNSRAVDDADGDGFTNLQEFQSGTDATNSASAFRITSVVVTGNDVDVTWTMGSGKTNALQATVGDGGSYTNAFADLFVVTNTVGSVTNYLDLGAVTNVPARYYRVRLVP